MKTTCPFLSILVICLLLTGCSEDDSWENVTYMTAIINGDTVEFRTDPARVFAGTDGALTLFGKNCPERRAIRLDVPQVTGRHDLFQTGGANYLIGAVACPGETGSFMRWQTLEAAVQITSLDEKFIRGSFTMLADNPYPERIDAEITGEFNIRIE